jgi:hypothetical protein
MNEKEYERICLDRFLGEIKIIPDSVEAPKPPAPDFLIRFGSDVIGVEVTRLLPDSKGKRDTPQRQNSLRRRAMDLARDSYYEKNGHPLHVSAHFIGSISLEDNQLPGLAARLADFIASRAYRLEIHQGEVMEPCKYTNKLPEVAGLSLYRVTTPDSGAWSPSGSFWYRCALESDILPVLAKKEQKLNNYKAFSSKVWLLVIVENIEAGELISAEPSTMPFSVRSDFNRVYALNSISGKVSQIEVVHSQQ